MTLILTSDPTAVAANLVEIVRDAQADQPQSDLAPLAGLVSASELVGSNLQLTISDPNKLGASNILRSAPNEGQLGAAIKGRVGFAFTTLSIVDA